MGDFKYGLFGCFGDIKISLVTWCLPCFSFGRVAAHVNHKDFGFGGCLPCGAALFIPLYGCYASYMVRKASRDKAGASPMFNFWPEFIVDIFTGICCGCCATIQEARHFDLDVLKIPSGADIERS